jgi:hypothetical protein
MGIATGVGGEGLPASFRGSFNWVLAESTDESVRTPEPNTPG